MYDRAWKNRDEWALEHPNDKFTHMRKVAESYDWLVNKVVYGQYEGVLELPGRFFKTSDLQLTSCLVAHDYFLLRFDRDGYKFYFCEGAYKVSYEFASDTDCSAKWMRKYLERFEALKREIKQSRLDSSRVMKETCAT